MTITKCHFLPDTMLSDFQTRIIGSLTSDRTTLKVLRNTEYHEATVEGRSIFSLTTPNWKVELYRGQLWSNDPQQAYKVNLGPGQRNPALEHVLAIEILWNFEEQGDLDALPIYNTLFLGLVKAFVLRYLVQAENTAPLKEMPLPISCFLEQWPTN